MKVSLTLFGIGLCVIATTGCQSTNKRNANAQDRWNQVRARVKYQLATQQYEAGLFKDVVKTLAESIAQEGRVVESYVLLAQAHLELGDIGSASASVAAAAESGLISADLHYVRGVIFEQRDQFTEADEQYAEARRLEPDNVEFLVAHVECLVEMDQANKAHEILEQQSRASMDNPRVAALAGHVAALLGDVDAAVHRYRMAMATTDESPLIAEELGRLLIHAQRYDEALSVVRPLIDQTKESRPDGALRRLAATCHLALGDPVSARTVLGGYARSHPKDAAAQLLLAKAAVATNDWLTALRAAGLAERSAPDLAEVRLVRAVAYWKRGDLTSAVTELESLIETNPSDLEMHCLLAEVYRALGRSDDALSLFHHAEQLDEHSAWAAAGLRALHALSVEVPSETRP